MGGQIADDPNHGIPGAIAGAAPPWTHAVRHQLDAFRNGIVDTDILHRCRTVGIDDGIGNRLAQNDIPGRIVMQDDLHPSRWNIGPQHAAGSGIHRFSPLP